RLDPARAAPAVEPAAVRGAGGLRRARPRHRERQARVLELEELRVADHVGHHAERRPEGLPAQPRPHHHRHQGPRRQGLQGRHRGPDLDAGGPELHAMTTFSAIKDFLLRERTLGRARGATPVRRKRARQRGVALVAVMIAIAITLVISNEFGTSTNGDLMAAANYRDQMRSHFLARSALSLSELVIHIQRRIDNIQQLRDAGIRITDFADQVLLAFCGNSEEVQAAIGLSSSDAKGLGADVGTCGITGQITTDDDKLNLNCSNGNVQTTSKYLKSELDALIYFPAYDPVFEDPDADGYRRDRATQAAAIVDYIDADSQHVHDFGTTEDYGYENLKDRYRPKNNYIDTLGELRLVRGVDDRFWTLFGPAFTVYGGCQINVSALSNSQLIAAILYLSAKNPNDPVVQDPIKLFALAGLVAKAKQFGMT